jgi:hypothetical protein
MVSSAFLGDNSLLHHRTLPEEYGKYVTTPARSETQELTLGAKPSGEMPTLSTQVSWIHFGLGYDPMAPPEHDGESSQSVLTTYVHQQTWAAFSVSLKQDVEEGQDVRYFCPFCRKEFRAKKSISRHLDDVHSDPSNCPHSNCNYICRGKRKLRYHLDKVHGTDLHSGQCAATLSRKVVEPDPEPFSVPHCGRDWPFSELDFTVMDMFPDLDPLDLSLFLD